jgi:hypothetical protein
MRYAGLAAVILSAASTYAAHEMHRAPPPTPYTPPEHTARIEYRAYLREEDIVGHLDRELYRQFNENMKEE